MRKCLIMLMVAVMPVAAAAQDFVAPAPADSVEAPAVPAAMELPGAFALPAFEYEPLPVEVVAPVVKPLEVQPVDLSARYRFTPGRAELFSSGGFRLSAVGGMHRM